MDVFVSDFDYNLGKVLKYQKPNPIGEDVYLDKDGVTIHRDEDKIVKAQRIFKHNYYKPDGRGAWRALNRLAAATGGPINCVIPGPPQPSQFGS